MSEFQRRVGIGLVVLCVCIAPASGQDTGDESQPTEEMEEVEDVIVVTASRTEQRLHEVPAPRHAHTGGPG